MARLVERAQSEQWQIDRDIDWSALDMTILPLHVRASMLDIYSQTHFGEAVALRLANRALESTPESLARRFCGLQVIDEERHVAFFSRVVGLLGEPKPTCQSMKQFAALLDECDGPQEIALGVQVILEGFAQTIFQEGSRFGKAAARTAIQFPGTSVATRFLTLLGDYVGKDESRHVAFGLSYLKSHFSALNPADRSKLERKAVTWVRAITGVADEIGEVASALGIPVALLKANVLAVQRRHLRVIGMHDVCAELAVPL